MTLERWYADFPFYLQGFWCGGGTSPKLHTSRCSWSLRCVKT